MADGNTISDLGAWIRDSRKAQWTQAELGRWLGQLLEHISNIQVGDEASRAKNVLGRVYEYFPGLFALAEGRKDAERFLSRSVV